LSRGKLRGILALLVGLIFCFQPCLAAAELPKEKEQLKNSLLERYKRAESLFKEGSYERAKAAFISIATEAAKAEIDLGGSAERGLRKYLGVQGQEGLIDRKIREQKQAQEQERKKAREAEARAKALAEQRRLEEESRKKEGAAEREEEQKKARQQEIKNRLEEKYKRGRELFKDGRYSDSRKVFEEVATEAALKGLKLSRGTERGLRNYLGTPGKKGLIAKAVEEEKQKRLKAKEEAKTAEARKKEEQAAAERRRKEAEAEKIKKERQRVGQRLLREYAEAEDLFNNGRYEEARTRFQKIDSEKKKYNLLFSSARERALREYLGTPEKPGRIDLAIAEEDKRKREAAEAKKERELKKRAEEKPVEQLEAKYSRGVALYEKGDYAEAKKILEEVADEAERKGVKLSRRTEAGLRSYLGTPGEKGLIAKAIEEEQRKRLEEKRKAEAAAAKQREEAAAAERRRKQLEAERAAKQKELEKINEDIQEAQRLFGEKRYEEARTAFLKVRQEALAAGIDLGRTNQRIDNYLAQIKQAQESKARERKPEEVKALLAQIAEQKARAAVEKARKLRAEGDIPGAEKALEEALEYKPGYGPAKELQAELRAAGAPGPVYEKGILERELKETELEQQYQRVRMDALLRSAQGKAGEKKYDEALKIAESVLDLVKIHKEWPEDMRREYHDKANSLYMDLKEKKETFEEEERQKRALAAKLLTEEERESVKKARETQHWALMQQVRLYKLNDQYDKAEEILAELVKKNPDDIEARDELILVRRLLSMKKRGDWKLKREFERDQWIWEMDEKTIPYVKLLRYPEKQEWARITDVRKEAGVQQFIETTPEDTKVFAELEKRSDFDFMEARLQDVIEFIMSTYDINIVLDEQALEWRGEDVFINLKLKNVPLKTAFKFMLEPNDLKYIVKDGLIFISTPEEIQEEKHMITYDVRDLVASIPDFSGGGGGGLGATGTTGTTGTTGGGGGAAGQQLGGGGGTTTGGTTTGGGEGLAEALSPSEAADQLIQIIQDSIAPDSWAEGMGTAITYVNGQLIITQTRAIHEKIQKLLADLRSMRALQVSIEVRFLSMGGGFLESVGLTFNLLDFDYDDTDLFTSLTREFFASTDFPFSLGVGREFEPTGGFSGTLLYQFTDDIFVNMLISAVQKSQEADVLDAPLLTMFNGQRAYLEVVRTQIYVSGVNTVVAASAVGLDYETDEIETGVIFDVRPFVSADRRYVQMTIRPEVTRLLELISFELPIALGNNIFNAFIQAPIYETTTINTTVSVPDNGTLMIGGLTQTYDGQSEGGVPMISKVPILKRFFARTVSTRERRHLLIIIRPQIIIQEEQEPT